MPLRALLISLAALALLPASASAKMPRPAGVSIVVAPCPGYEWADGCYAADERRVYVRRAGDRATRLHELGHAFDSLVLTDADRAMFTRMLGMRAQPWLGEVGAVSPGERFADAYARCGAPLRRGWHEDTAYGYTLEGTRHRAICNAIIILGYLSERGDR